MPLCLVSQFIKCYAECCYPECRYAECLSAKTNALAYLASLSVTKNVFVNFRWKFHKLFWHNLNQTLRQYVTNIVKLRQNFFMKLATGVNVKNILGFATDAHDK